jgi:hypothetical protein
MKDNNNKEVKETKEVKDNKEETKTKPSSIKKPLGFNIDDLPEPEEDSLDNMPETMRTLVMPNVFIEEIVRDIFIPLELTEENGLINVYPADSNELILAWDTAKLSLEQDNEELFIIETNEKVSIIESLLFSRYNDGLLVGAKDIEGNKFRVLDEANPIISNSFELVVDFNKKDVNEAINLIKDTIKLPPQEYNKILLTKRPASNDPTGFSNTKASVLIINRSAEEMDNLSTAYKTERFGRKVNKAINKSSQTVYGTAKMIGQKIMIPASEVMGATIGTLGGAAAQSIGVAASEGANEFRKSFNINAIKERTSTQELIQAFTKGKKKSTRGGAF